MDLSAYLNQQQERMECALDAMLADIDSPSPRIIEAIRHSLMGAGKRIRPILMLASCRAVGGNDEHAIPMACAMECIHTYSLIHDDLPAMDDDDLRRGRPTCHKAFDEATAILAGDALLTHAFHLAAQHVPHLSLSAHLDLISSLSKAAGITGMVGGQMLDMDAENRTISLEEMQTIHRHKTGALLRFSCVSGARIGHASEDHVNRLKQYGDAIGLAFQIADDILDVVGDTTTLGKPAGSDDRQAKSTYPRLMGLDGARQEAQRQHTIAVEALAPFSNEADPLRAIAAFIVHRTH
ncbi:MAG: polyprenyl synthetase family protein [Magnetococcales bacterium]|nr:polyprenyl synthetase family protein [Magnetococcales bacterium]